MGKFKDITGNKYNKLTAISVTSRVDHTGNKIWIFECDCGNIVERASSRVTLGHTKSCGCIHKEVITSHGMVNTKEYRTWNRIINRTTNPNFPNYDKYGGAGIKVCDRWRGSFQEFYNDMGKAPSSNHSIDRKDPTKGYFPENCRWATSREQSWNTRSRRASVKGYKGISYDKDRDMWTASLRRGSHHCFIGRYTTEDEAAYAYDLALKTIYGENEFVRLNNAKECYINTDTRFFNYWVPLLKEEEKQ